MEGDRSHDLDIAAAVAAEGQPTPSNEAPSDAPSTEAAGDPELSYTPLGVWVKEAKYSGKSQRGYVPMQISEEDRHSPKFALPHNIELSVRTLIELFSSDSIIRTIRRHMDAYGRSKADSLRTASDLDIFDFLLLCIPWRLSHCRRSQTIGTPEAYGQITSHAPMCHFLGSR